MLLIENTKQKINSVGGGGPCNFRRGPAISHPLFRRTLFSRCGVQFIHVAGFPRKILQEGFTPRSSRIAYCVRNLSDIAP